MGRKVVRNIRPTLKEYLIMNLEQRVGDIQQRHLNHVIIHLRHSELNGPLGCGLDRKVSRLSESSTNNPFENATNSSDMQYSSPVVPYVSVLSSTLMVTLPHREDALILTVEGIENILALVLIPQRYELTGSFMLAGFLSTSPTHNGHLLQ